MPERTCTEQYEVKCCKAWLQVHEALCFNCKWMHASISRFFLCKKSNCYCTSLAAQQTILAFGCYFNLNGVHTCTIISSPVVASEDIFVVLEMMRRNYLKRFEALQGLFHFQRETKPNCFTSC